VNKEVATNGSQVFNAGLWISQPRAV